MSEVVGSEVYAPFDHGRCGRLENMSAMMNSVSDESNQGVRELNVIQGDARDAISW